MYLKNFIIDYDNNIKEIEKWVSLKSEEKYIEYGKILVKNGVKDISWKQLDDYFRYDKRLLFNLFRYFSMFEEFLRAKLVNANVYKLKELDKLLFSKLCDKVIDNLDKIDLNGCDKDIYTMNNFIIIGNLRNVVCHQRIVVNFKYEGTKIEDAIKLFSKFLPETYRTNFIRQINECKNKLYESRLYISL